MNKYLEYITKIEKEIAGELETFNNIALNNQYKVLNAFRQNGIASRHFAQTTGYGYDDLGREALGNLFSTIFNTEKAIVSPLIMSGTHALYLTISGILRPGDTFVSVTGKPYDTLNKVIKGGASGNFAEFGIKYDEIAYEDEFDYSKIKAYFTEKKPKLALIQRSRGYNWRNAITINEMQKAISFIKELSPETNIMVDNCYGEFVSEKEPTDVGADIAAGSLIKNPGGGIAPTGGYIVGKSDLIEMIANRFTAPCLGMEIGSYNGSYLPYFLGLFLAPHTVSGAVKGAVLAARVFKSLGYETLPRDISKISDIICSIKFGNKNELISFCRAIQKASPIDSNVTPYPWDMPGYEDQVIMAAGTFVQGASIELSADSPICEPYIAYMQGGITYEHIKIALIETLQDLNLL